MLPKYVGGLTTLECVKRGGRHAALGTALSVEKRGLEMLYAIYFYTNSPWWNFQFGLLGAPGIYRGVSLSKFYTGIHYIHVYYVFYKVNKMRGSGGEGDKKLHWKVSPKLPYKLVFILFFRVIVFFYFIIFFIRMFTRRLTISCSLKLHRKLDVDWNPSWHSFKHPKEKPEGDFLGDGCLREGSSKFLSDELPSKIFQPNPLIQGPFAP